jgi:cyclopropane-fatty-acyl-phospholipid synthase
MSLISSAIRAAERAPLPDPLTRMGIEFLVGRTRRKLAAASSQEEEEFARAMAEHPIAEHADAANEQHYELPPEFFALTLGPHSKYSCCLYPTGEETLADAERLALEETIAHADLTDRQSILELGCGWGSLTLFMAERFPHSTITAVSNSIPQRIYIEARAAERGLANVRVITADMNSFMAEGTYDRIVSVEMFEHMSNWRGLLERIREWLRPETGRLFIHVFSHKHSPYRFDHKNEADWIAQHFFTGGIMPSHGLLRHFQTALRLNRTGVGVGSITRRLRWTGWRASMKTASGSIASWMRFTAPTLRFGASAGVSSIWRRLGCSGTPAAPNGA